MVIDLGPVEVLVIAFPEDRFAGDVIPELNRLIDSGLIDLIDGLLIRKDDDDRVSFEELGDLPPDHPAAGLAGMLHQVESLVSDADVEAFATLMDRNSSEAILVVEHKWAKRLSDAVVDAGGHLAASFRVPKRAVGELLAELAGTDDPSEE